MSYHIDLIVTCEDAPWHYLVPIEFAWQKVRGDIYLDGEITWWRIIDSDNECVDLLEKKDGFLLGITKEQREYLVPYLKKYIRQYMQESLEAAARHKVQRERDDWENHKQAVANR